MLEIGGERAEGDFDIHEIIQNNKILRHQIQVIKGKLNVDNDPRFDEVDPNTIIDVTEQAE